MSKNSVDMKELHYWPKIELSKRSIIKHAFTSARVIEQMLGQIYNHEIVLTGSGRSSISLLLLFLNIKRGDYIYTNRYSSHCVISSIGLLGNPVFEITDSIKHAIAYRQWGYDYNYNTLRKKVKGEVIEDIADSLFATKSFKFKEDQRFAICSLPKIISSFNGGAIICRNKIDADKLRKMREMENIINPMLNDCMRLRGYGNTFCANMWHGYACRATEVSWLSRANIKTQIKKYRLKYIQREDNISKLYNSSDHSKLNGNCMPCCIPFKINSINTNIDEKHNAFIINNKLRLPIRMFNASRDYVKENWIRVACIPVHTPLNIDTLKNTTDYARSSPIYTQNSVSL